MKNIVGVGLGFGDEGKGSMIDYFVSSHGSKLVVRFNGGPQAAHNVETPKNIHHCFSQFGSGTLIGAETYLSEKTLVDPLRILNEAKVLKRKGIKNPLRLLIIDPECVVVTPMHALINQMREISRKSNRHGSCGIGVGEAAQDEQAFGERSLRVSDFFDKKTLYQKIRFLQQMKIDIAEQLVDDQPDNQELIRRLSKLKQTAYVQLLAESYQNFALNSGVRVEKEYLGKPNQYRMIIFEGAQGILLDERYGFFPYVTKSNSTFRNAEKLIGRYCPNAETVQIGILRAYSTRHGNGPFVTKDQWLAKKIPDRHNGINEWQGNFRIGWLDLLTTRYALSVANNVNEVALTNLDRLTGLKKIKVCVTYEYLGSQSVKLDDYFQWERFGNNRIRVKALRKVDTDDGAFTQLLFQCKPLDLLEFPCWLENISSVKDFESLPKEAKKYIHFLESKSGIDLPISIVSVGSTRVQKFER